jgi:glutamate-ammonia-ligase adenylyltransferase
MKPETATQLAAGLHFLRRVEHRIQYLDDQQTHLLPSGDDDLRWIAQLGLVCEPEACELLDRLGEVRELVANEFDALLHDGQGRTAQRLRQHLQGLRQRPASGGQRGLLERLPPVLADAAAPWVQQPRVQALRDESRCAWAA